MAFGAGFQLNLEITRIFGAANQVATGVNNLISFARELRNSGSEIVVEEDLATIFGRGKIQNEIEIQFRQDVVKNTRLVPLYEDCGIHLRSGPGPTVLRALRDQDRRYMATVIQLSMLTSVHETASLATTLVECMAHRFRLNVPGSASPPEHADVLGTLNGCSSQTSSFDWTGLFNQVSSQVLHHFPDLERVRPSGCAWDRSQLIQLPATVLFAAMDYLFMTQRFPEERKILFQTLQGVVTLVVWAFHLLDLNVSVTWNDKSPLHFGKGSTQVYVEINEQYQAAKCAISLLDSREHVILQTTSTDLDSRLRLDAEERLPLQGIGAEYIRRELGSDIALTNSDVLFEQTAEYAIALTIHLAQNLRHECNELIGEDTFHIPHSVDVWRIFESADIIFHGISYDKEGVESYVSYLGREKRTSLWNEFPGALRQHTNKATNHWLQTYRNTEAWDNQPNQPYGVGHGGAAQTPIGQFENMMKNLLDLILAFAHVTNVHECAPLPITLRGWASNESRHISPSYPAKLPVTISATSIFDKIARCMTGTLSHGMKDRTVLVSAFGWSVFLGTLQDCDPANAGTLLLRIRPGTPTNSRTQQQRSRIGDVQLKSNLDEPDIKVEDRGPSYTPRCLTAVTKRQEYCSTQLDDFQLSLHFEKPDDLAGRLLEIQTGYYELHECLWKTPVIGACSHASDASGLTSARLGPGAITVSGVNFHLEVKERELGKKGEIVGWKTVGKSEKVCVALVREDRWARWLAVLKGNERNASHRPILRGNQCCENCALDDAQNRPGRWIVIL